MKPLFTCRELLSGVRRLCRRGFCGLSHPPVPFPLGCSKSVPRIRCALDVLRSIRFISWFSMALLRRLFRLEVRRGTCTGERSRGAIGGNGGYRRRNQTLSMQRRWLMIEVTTVKVEGLSEIWCGSSICLASRWCHSSPQSGRSRVQGKYSHGPPPRIVHRANHERIRKEKEREGVRWTKE